MAFAITIFAIGFFGSFVSGMLGIGGSIIKYPMLLYLPPLLGVGAFTPHDVAALSAVQVVFATISGVFMFRQSGYLHMRLTAVMGGSILAGSFLGAWGSSGFSQGTINTTYALLATVAAGLMLLPGGDRKGVGEPAPGHVPFDPYIAGAAAFVIGTASGIVGAAGAFLLVPVMLKVLKIPTRVTIATSLAVTFVAAIGSAGGKLATGQVPLLPAVVMIVASLPGAAAGARFSTRINPRTLRTALALLIAATAAHIWLAVFQSGLFA